MVEEAHLSPERGGNKRKLRMGKREDVGRPVHWSPQSGYYDIIIQLL
jgi:hypothetical protein